MTVMYVNVVLGGFVERDCFSLEEENGREQVHMETPAALNN